MSTRPLSESTRSTKLHVWKIRVWGSKLALIALALVVLQGSDCPIQVGTGTGGGGSGSSGSTGGPAVDIGGNTGALWQVSTDNNLLVTLRTADGHAASAQIPVGRGDVTLLGRTILIADFCWRPEIACPQHVLSEATGIRQPQDGGQVLITFNARGPLAQLKGNALAGTLRGKDLMVPLAVDAAAQGACGLLSTSAIGGTAFSDDTTAQASALSGRVAVTYAGGCLALGGNAAIDPEDVVQISANFTATRQ